MRVSSFWKKKLNNILTIYNPPATPVVMGLLLIWHHPAMFYLPHHQFIRNFFLSFQWLGESRLRSLMEGRIVLVKLLCKDTGTCPLLRLSLRLKRVYHHSPCLLNPTANVRIGVFSPCIAFRVAGSPGRRILNLSSALRGVRISLGDLLSLDLHNTHFLSLCAVFPASRDCREDK